MLDRLPPSLQQCLLLEWLSPECVCKVARASGALRHAVLESPQAFRAAEGEVLSDACVRWFREHDNDKLHREGDLPAVVHSNGTRQWYWHGKRHRDNDLPAVVVDGGILLYWYQHGTWIRSSNGATKEPSWLSWPSS